MRKRIVSLLLSLFLIFGLFFRIPEASAATLDSKAGAVTTSGSPLNVRASASTSAATVATLNKGSYVTLISRSGSWWRVEYAKDKYGYCHADYITVVSGTPATVTASALNVRSGAGTSHAIAGYLHQGDAVIVLSSSGGWSRVLYHGTKTGYVSSQYLSGYYAPVSLWVPNLKQADNRWSGALIGESGKTIAQIGCATTAIAMVESHRRGYTIYPDIMASELTYTPGGSVYWPSHYTTVTSDSGLLSGIYTRLKQGKPVLFGARNAAGSQHWVVITGFSGGSSLTAANFTIQDPGTWSRTNLQQLLDAFPTFYKYFYY